MGRTANTGDGKGLVDSPSKKGSATDGTRTMAEGRAPSKKAPSAMEGASKKLMPAQGKK
jgi:hypothetical protein